MEEAEKSSTTSTSRWYRLPEGIVGCGIFVVLLSFVSFYLIDLHNFLGLRDYLASLNPFSFFFHHRPFVFYHWYRNGGIAEIIQWLFLGGAAATAAFTAGKLQEKDRKAYLFWGLMAVAFVLLLIEDAGDPRHTIRSYVQAFFGEAEQGTMGSITELIYFSLLGLIPLYTLFKYGRVLLDYTRSGIYMLLGFVCYGAATGLSFIGSAIDFYHLAGQVLYDFFVSIGDDAVGAYWESAIAEEGWDFISFFLMDSLVEEAIELIGAASLLAAAVAFLIAISDSSQQVTE